MRKDYIGTLYTGVSDAFQRGLYPIARCLKAEKHDLSVVEVIKLAERVDMKNEYNKLTEEKRREEKRREEKMVFVLLVAWTIRLITRLKVQTECMTPLESLQQ